jgi:hypothetical protein
MKGDIQVHGGYREEQRRTVWYREDQRRTYRTETKREQRGTERNREVQIGTITE